MGNVLDARIDEVRAAAYSVPTDFPEGDGTLAWNSTTMVVCEVRAGGATGLGYTYEDQSCVPLIEGKLGPMITGHDAMDVPGGWTKMQRGIRNLGWPGLVACSLSAVETALYDAKARLLGIPLSSLFGRVRDTVEVYGSGGFTTYPDDRTRSQLRRWVHDLRIPRVKIKIGEAWGSQVDRDLHRVSLARETIGDDVELFVDANGAYSVAQAVRVGHALADRGVTWYEEPVSSDHLAGLRQVRSQLAVDVAAGEYGYHLPYFTTMVDAEAVDCLQVDATRCGGYGEWLRTAAVAAGHNLEVSGHCAPNLTAHVASATPNFRHLEYFHDHVRIEDRLFDGALSPADGSLRPDLDRPGHGLSLKHTAAEAYRVA